MASSSTTFTSENNVSINLVALMVDSGASGHYFDDTIIRDLKHRLQDYVHLSTPRTILIAGEALVNVTAEGVLQGLVTNDNGNQILVRVDIVVVPRNGRNLFLVMTAAKMGIATILDYENPMSEGFSVTIPLRSESDDLDAFVLDLNADRYGTKELVMDAVANAQVWHRWLDHLLARSLDNLRKLDGAGITFGGAVSDCNAHGASSTACSPQGSQP